jgi:hypothetical protein
MGSALYAAAKLDAKPPLPSQMDKVDAYELKSIVLELGEVDRQAKLQAEPLMKRRTEILAKYQIKMDTDQVDLIKEIGKIVRGQEKAASRTK